RNELTDKDGYFSIREASLPAQLEVSAIGFVKRRITITAAQAGGKVSGQTSGEADRQADGQADRWAVGQADRWAVGQAGGLVIDLQRGALDLKEVTITRLANSAAGSFHSLSRIDLNLQPTRSAQDLLRLVPGLFIAQHQGGGKAEQIFLRGFDADHGTDVNISVDGLPVNMVSQAHGQGYADLHFVIPETIGSYDFGKGPYYAERGDFTTAGYVAYTTKNSFDHDIVKFEAGRFQ